MKGRAVYILINVLLLSNVPVGAQLVLDEYIREGLSNNIVLRQKVLSYEKAIASLREAESYFLPTVSSSASYTSGEGGRSISIPVGTLLNPVYQTLNQLTGSGAFPEVQNVRESFLPSRFYDAKIRTAVPLLNTDLIYGRQIQAQRVNLESYDVSAYRKELVKSITIAYFTLLSAQHAVEIYDNALSSAVEALRVNKSLLVNGKGLPVYVLRAEAEEEAIQAKKLESEHQLTQARRYFNFLLNRRADEQIKMQIDVDEPDGSLVEAQDSMFSPDKREEVAMAREAVGVYEAVVGMEQHSWLPKVGAFLDLGLQDRWAQSTSDSRYYLFGIQIEVPIFEAFRSTYRTRKAEFDLSKAKLELESVQRRLGLSASLAHDNLADAKQQYRSSRKQFAMTSRYYQTVMRGYQEGVNLFIETVDARTQLLNASLAVNISKYKVRIARAVYERESGTTTLSY